LAGNIISECGINKHPAMGRPEKQGSRSSAAACTEKADFANGSGTYRITVQKLVVIKF